MSAAPGTEFPNPCPICGADDEHSAWRGKAESSPHFGFGATHCPHPSEAGHGTGCCCAGRSKPLIAYPSVTADRLGPYTNLKPAGDAVSADLEDSGPSLAQRVAHLEATAMTEDEVARFRAVFQYLMTFLLAEGRLSVNEARSLLGLPELYPEPVKPDAGQGEAVTLKHLRDLQLSTGIITEEEHAALADEDPDAEREACGE